MASEPEKIWSRDATMRCLNQWPLPPDFVWPHRDDAGKERPVRPIHAAVIGYGKWLRETPYFPGIFELAHDILTDAPDEIDAAWLPAQLQELRAKYGAEPARPNEHFAQKLRRLRPAVNQVTFL